MNCLILNTHDYYRGRGIVVNMSSTAAAIAHPLLNVYSASKVIIIYHVTTLFTHCGT